MELELFQRFYINKIIQLCDKHHVNHIVMKNDNGTPMRVAIYCTYDVYLKIFKYNKYINKCNNVYINVGMYGVKFDLSEGGNIND